MNTKRVKKAKNKINRLIFTIFMLLLIIIFSSFNGNTKYDCKIDSHKYNIKQLIKEKRKLDAEMVDMKNWFSQREPKQWSGYEGRYYSPIREDIDRINEQINTHKTDITSCKRLKNLFLRTESTI